MTETTRSSRDELVQRIDDLIKDREDMRDRVDELTEALHKIKIWSEAYPLDIFPEPDWVKVRAVLAQGNITIDAVSASVMRRLVEGVGRIAREALQQENPDV